MRAAAPEITSIEVVAAERGFSTCGAHPGRFTDEPHPAQDTSAAGWHPAPDIADLGAWRGGRLPGRGRAVLACRVGDDLFAYHDRCGRCAESLAGAQLHRPMGALRAGRDRRRYKRCCGARAAARTSTSCMQVQAWTMRLTAHASRPDPPAAPRRRAVGRGARRGHRGDVMPGSAIPESLRSPPQAEVPRPEVHTTCWRGSAPTNAPCNRSASAARCAPSRSPTSTSTSSMSQGAS